MARWFRVLIILDAFRSRCVSLGQGWQIGTRGYGWGDVHHVNDGSPAFLNNLRGSPKHFSSNGGVFGSLYGTPIINLPQAAVLGHVPRSHFFTHAVILTWLLLQACMPSRTGRLL